VNQTFGINFDAFAFFEEGSDVPSTTEVFTVMEAADYQEFIQQYAWNASNSSPFVDTMRVVFMALVWGQTDAKESNALTSSLDEWTTHALWIANRTFDTFIGYVFVFVSFSQIIFVPWNTLMDHTYSPGFNQLLLALVWSGHDAINNLWYGIVDYGVERNSTDVV
jgi:hypothetical protein